jgi:hypothetical protein
MRHPDQGSSRRKAEDMAHPWAPPSKAWGDLYVVEFGDEEERARYRAERETERGRVRQRYVERMITHADLDGPTGERAVAAIFDHVTEDGSQCLRGCHPQLSPQHGNGMECPCSWDRERRKTTHRAWLADLRDSEWAKAMREQHDAEEREIRDWPAGQVAVTAVPTSQYAPGQWEGAVDGLGCYFRKRHG